MSKTIKLLLTITVILISANCTQSQKQNAETFIRINQVGFLPSDVKSAVVLSGSKIDQKPYQIVDRKGSVILNGILPNSSGAYGEFPFSYRVYFSKLRKFGTYKMKIGNSSSYDFQIGSKIYNPVVDSLLQFFKVQRSGYTNPRLHKVSHIADATSILDAGKVINETHDVTGGWYDAGDYIKFVNTTAYATYTLLFAYDFAPHKFSFDHDKNGVPDILEEAKIGLDWLLRAQYKGKKLIVQVQDLRDHDVGWRLPEDDPLAFDRPAFVGIGKNLIGVYVAAMSLGSKIWREKINYPEYADQCLTAAENYYALKDNAPDVDSTGTHYIDKLFAGKMALGAIELFLATGRKDALADAKMYGDKDGSEVWWSWGNIAAYAHYRLAKIEPRFGDYLKVNLSSFNKNKEKMLFNEGAAYTWGTNNTLLGVSLQNILYRDLTNSNEYDTVSVYQRDYILGRNAWGVSFIAKIGTEYSRNFHHQIAYLQNGYLPGGFAAGPISKEFLDGYNIPFDKPDRFSKFQTKDAVYRDDRMDYVTNEPTITANATAVFVMGYYSNR
ncbi:MAG: glycoside hydrolase family 9 protein [Melioribacteraceae bacterium]|nr:glycoside hydrolase family 9 protein [Melioribacteraceae bacterium]